MFDRLVLSIWRNCRPFFPIDWFSRSTRWDCRLQSVQSSDSVDLMRTFTNLWPIDRCCRLCALVVNVCPMDYIMQFYQMDLKLLSSDRLDRGDLLRRRQFFFERLVPSIWSGCRLSVRSTAPTRHLMRLLYLVCVRQWFSLTLGNMITKWADQTPDVLFSLVYYRQLQSPDAWLISDQWVIWSDTCCVVYLVCHRPLFS